MKTKTLTIENDWVGTLESIFHLNNYQSAVDSLHNAIKSEFSHLLTEFPKSKWSVGYYEDGKGKKEGSVVLYSIATSKINKLKKLNLW